MNFNVTCAPSQAHPARAPAEFSPTVPTQSAKAAAHRLRNIQGHEEAHGSSLACRRVRPGCGCTRRRGNSGGPCPEPFATRTSGCVRGRRGIARGMSWTSVGVGERDVHQSDGLFRRAAAGPGNAGDPDADASRRCGRRMPSASACATSGLTAPRASISAAGTSAHAVLSSLL